MQWDRRLSRLAIGAVALGFVMLIAIELLAASTILRNQQQTRWVNHTYQVEHAISQYRVISERLEAARRGLLLRNDTGPDNTFIQTAALIEPSLADLRRL